MTMVVLHGQKCSSAPLRRPPTVGVRRLIKAGVVTRFCALGKADKLGGTPTDSTPVIGQLSIQLGVVLYYLGSTVVCR